MDSQGILNNNIAVIDLSSQKQRLKLILFFVLYWFATNYINVLIHEVSHGLISILLGGGWDAIYVSPINGFVYTRSPTEIHSFIVTVAGTGGVVFWGVLFYSIRKRVENSFIRLILLAITFFAATEPLLYFGMGALMYMGGQLDNLGDPGELIRDGVHPLLIVATSVLILVLLFPRFYKAFYSTIKPQFDMDFNNLKRIFYIVFIPFNILRGFMICIMQFELNLFILLMYTIYGIFFSVIGIYFILKYEHKLIKQQSIQAIDVNSEADSSVNSIGNIENKEIKGRSEVAFPVTSRIHPIFGKKQMASLGVLTLLVMGMWLGVFGFTENVSIGLNWNEDPYIANVNIHFNPDSTININYSFLPEFPVKLGNMVFSWENYKDLSLNFSDILIGSSIIESDLSYSIDSSMNTWGLNSYHRNSRTVAITNNLPFASVQNITVLGNHIEYNITDPWQFYQPLSFLDQIDIQYPSNYILESVKFYKHSGLISITPFLNLTGHIIIQNPTLSVAPLIIQLELIKIS